MNTILEVACHAGRHFGAVVSDVAKAPYKVGDTAKVTFQSACPRNNVRTGDTFLAVQKLNEDTGDWTTVSTSSLSMHQAKLLLAVWISASTTGFTLCILLHGCCAKSTQGVVARTVMTVCICILHLKERKSFMEHYNGWTEGVEYRAVWFQTHYSAPSLSKALFAMLRTRCLFQSKCHIQPCLLWVVDH